MTIRMRSFSLLLPAAVGCAVGPRYQPAAVSIPPAWQEAPAGEASAQGPGLERWWTAFRDPTLDSLVARAVAGNLELEIAAARIREARGARDLAAAAAWPQVAVGAAYTRAQRSDAVPPFRSVRGGDAPFGPREQNVFETGFDASWELDIFGGIRRNEEAARAQVQVAEETRRDVLVTLLADVARNYVELRGTQQQAAILKETVRSQSETLDLARARLEAGLGTELDVARAQGLLAATVAERPVLERQASQAIHRLGVLLGTDPGALAPKLEMPGALPAAPPQIPLTLPSELLSRRPDVRRAEREFAAATARVGAARAELFPRFSLLGSLGRRSDDVSDLSSSVSQYGSIGAGMRWPIFSAGRIRADIRAHDARREQALRQYEQAVLAALEEVENAISAHSREQQRRRSLEASVAAHRSALDLAMDRYASGLESFLSVLDAQRSVYAAEDQLVQNERDSVVSLIAVYKALGGGWGPEDPTLQRPEASRD